jgi:hypothetical protein
MKNLLNEPEPAWSFTLYYKVKTRLAILSAMAQLVVAQASSPAIVAAGVSPAGNRDGRRDVGSRDGCPTKA